MRKCPKTSLLCERLCLAKPRPITPMKRSIRGRNAAVLLNKWQKSRAEPQVTIDMYTTVPPHVAYFSFFPKSLLRRVSPSLRNSTRKRNCLPTCEEVPALKSIRNLQALSETLESLRSLSSRLAGFEDITGMGAEQRLIKAVSKKSRRRRRKTRSGKELLQKRRKAREKTRIARCCQRIFARKEEKSDLRLSPLRQKKGVKMVTHYPEKTQKEVMA